MATFNSSTNPINLSEVDVSYLTEALELADGAVTTEVYNYHLILRLAIHGLTSATDEHLKAMSDTDPLTTGEQK